MSVFYEIGIVFKFFFRYILRQKKTRFFLILSFIPTILFLLIFSLKTGKITPSRYFQNMTVWYYFQFLIPIMALFFGNSVITEEVENKTLHYLTASSVRKSSIVLGKYLAYSLITLIIVNLSIIITYFVSLIFGPFNASDLSVMVKFVLISIPSLFAYFSLFVFGSSVLKKPTIVGVIYLFGWEVLIQFLPGSTQKLCVNHYVNSLLPAHTRLSAMSFLQFFKPEKPIIAFVALVFITLIFLYISILIFKNKEFLLSD